MTCMLRHTASTHKKGGGESKLKYMEGTTFHVRAKNFIVHLQKSTWQKQTFLTPFQVCCVHMCVCMPSACVGPCVCKCGTRVYVHIKAWGWCWKPSSVALLLLFIEAGSLSQTQSSLMWRVLLADFTSLSPSKTGAGGPSDLPHIYIGSGIWTSVLACACGASTESFPLSHKLNVSPVDV